MGIKEADGNLRCADCSLIRFVKPDESGRSFCVGLSEAEEIRSNIHRANFSVEITKTHEELTKDCDHPELFKNAHHQGKIRFGMGGPLFHPKEKG